MTFSMTLTDPQPVFQVMEFLKSNVTEMVRLRDKVTHRTLAGNHIQCVEWYHFEWPRITPDRDLKVIELSTDIEYFRNDKRYSHYKT